MSAVTIRRPSSVPEPGDPVPPAAASDQIDLAEYGAAIWRGRFLIAAVTIAAVAIAVVMSLKGPEQYAATVMLVVNQGKTGDQTSPQLPVTAASFRPLVESRV